MKKILRNYNPISGIIYLKLPWQFVKTKCIYINWLNSIYPTGSIDEYYNVSLYVKEIGDHNFLKKAVISGGTIYGRYILRHYHQYMEYVYEWLYNPSTRDWCGINED